MKEKTENTEKTEKKLKKQILEIVFCILFGLLFIMIISTAVTLTQGKQPSVFGYSFLHVETGSMEPAIPEASLIVVKNIEENEVANIVKVNDIIVYFDKSLGVTITHRVVSIDYENETIITRGDANKKDDKVIHFYDVYSIYLKRLPVLTSIVNFLSNPIGFVVCIIIPLLALIVLYIVSIVKNSTKLAFEKAEQEKQAHNQMIIEEAIRNYEESLNKTQNIDEDDNKKE